MRYPAQSAVRISTSYYPPKSFVETSSLGESEDEGLVAALGGTMGMIDGSGMAYVVACEMMPRTTVSNQHPA